MKNCIVTGATSGIGKAIAARLVKEGYTVYGLGRDFSGVDDIPAGDGLFAGITCDLRDANALKVTAEFLKKKAKTVDVLVNCAGVAYYGVAESLTPEQISEMVDVNVKAPLILTSVLLPALRESSGVIVNVSSVTAKRDSNTHGAAYGATKAALTSFGTSLFEEARKHGVRVVNLHPDLTATNLYRNADFTVSGEPDSTLTPEDVAGAAMFAINAREGMCVTDITVRPQRNRIVKK